jgi:hypothetical protein
MFEIGKLFPSFCPNTFHIFQRFEHLDEEVPVILTTVGLGSFAY